MRIYETTFIVNPQTDDASIDRDVTSVSDLITTDGGKILHENRMGTRRLAYPIEKLTQGYYTTLVYESDPAVLPKLERHFKLGETYMRHLTIRFEGDVNKIGQTPDYGSPFKRAEKEPSTGGKEAPGKAQVDSKPATPEQVDSKPATPEQVVTEAASVPETDSAPAPEPTPAPAPEEKEVVSETVETVTDDDTKKAEDTAPMEVIPTENNEDDEL